MSLAYFDCNTGVAGDMMLGALLDLQDPRLTIETLTAGLSSVLDKKEWSIRSYSVRKGTGQIAATKVDVILAGVQDDPDKHGHGHGHSHGNDHHHGHGHGHGHPAHDDDVTPTSYDHPNPHHRTFAFISTMIEKSQLPTPVKQQSILVFRKLAEAEASCHGVNPDDVHFHEVGAVDSIIDTVGCVYALHLLGVDRVYCSPLPFTTGTVKTQHGILAVPAPATLKVLAGTGVMFRPSTLKGECVTPTGAALLATLCQGRGTMPPSFELLQVGHGAGTKDFDETPNILRVLVGKNTSSDSLRSSSSSSPLSKKTKLPTFQTKAVIKLETNVDDMTGELCGYVRQIILRLQGVLDVWCHAIMMKKDRPGIMLSVLCETFAEEECAELIFRETTTLGIRRSVCERHVLERSLRTIDTGVGQVAVKVGERNGDVLNVKIEFEDARKIAEEKNMPLKMVYSLAQAGVQELELFAKTRRDSAAAAAVTLTKTGTGTGTDTRVARNADGNDGARLVRRTRTKAREAEDVDEGYTTRIAELERRMRSKFLASLGEK